VTFRTTNCIAFGANDIEAAASFYEKALGFRRIKDGDGWIELETGALRIFVTKDDGTTPTFDLSVEDVQSATQHLQESGFTLIGAGDGENFVRDPFGNAFAVSKTTI
jgi:catechol 2,3-dioxygenase-like lactoylglutathione lyase family enzyme